MGRRKRADDGKSREQALDELYATLPDIDCRGACWDSCTSIGMTRVERRRAEAAGVHIPPNDGAGEMVCPALTMLHQCSIHQVRPAICRLWGLTESMPCTFGCRPEGGRLLTERELHEFMAKVHEASGEHAEARQWRMPWQADPELAEQLLAERRKVWREQELAEQLRRKKIIASGKPVMFVRGRGQISSTPPSSGANS